eukprot:4196422-Ditylum_brightwellii.AAC.1
MSASDRLLFYTDLEDCLKSSPKSKHLWLESVQIAVHDFTVVDKQTPGQRLVTKKFPQCRPPTTDPQAQPTYTCLTMPAQYQYQP